MGREDRVGRRAREDAAKDAADKAQGPAGRAPPRALAGAAGAGRAPARPARSLGLVLIAINRVAGLVLPACTRYVIDDVIGQRRVELLLPILGAVVARHRRPGHHVVRPDPDALQGRPAAHHGPAPARAGPRRPAARLLLRREQDGQPRVADHERRRRRAEPRGHRARGVRGRAARLRRRPRPHAADQPGHDGGDRGHRRSPSRSCCFAPSAPCARSSASGPRSRARSPGG